MLKILSIIITDKWSALHTHDPFIKTITQISCTY